MGSEKADDVRIILSMVTTEDFEIVQTAVSFGQPLRSRTVGL